MKKFRALLNMVVKNSNGRGGGLALFWKAGVKVSVNPMMSRYHIDADVTGDDGFVSCGG